MLTKPPTRNSIPTITNPQNLPATSSKVRPRGNLSREATRVSFLAEVFWVPGMTKKKNPTGCKKYLQLCEYRHNFLGLELRLRRGAAKLLRTPSRLSPFSKTPPRTCRSSPNFAAGSGRRRNFSPWDCHFGGQKLCVGWQLPRSIGRKETPFVGKGSKLNNPQCALPRNGDLANMTFLADLFLAAQLFAQASSELMTQFAKLSSSKGDELQSHLLWSPKLFCFGSQK